MKIRAKLQHDEEGGGIAYLLFVALILGLVSAAMNGFGNQANLLLDSLGSIAAR